MNRRNTAGVSAYACAGPIYQRISATGRFIIDVLPVPARDVAASLHRCDVHTLKCRYDDRTQTHQHANMPTNHTGLLYSYACATAGHRRRVGISMYECEALFSAAVRGRTELQNSSRAALKCSTPGKFTRVQGTHLSHREYYEDCLGYLVFNLAGDERARDLGFGTVLT